MRPSVLIISPTPPIPAEYGNRNRVNQTWSFFRDLGYEISFILYPMDTDWEKRIPSYYKELQNLFYYFDVVANSKILYRPPIGYHFDIDEWWDENLSVELEWLFKHKRFDIVFVNYPFFSKAFEFCPKGTLKILDTHDAFAGRRELFEQYGVAPEYFYTTESEENAALNRADIVLGIKKEEAIAFGNRTSSKVISLPYWREPEAKPAEQETNKSSSGKITAGFIGAANSVNSVNMRNFLRKLAAMPRINDDRLRIVVAGNVCDSLDQVGDWLELRGRVQSVHDFYGEMDVIIAPLEFSTGIKIKVGEALSFGKPVVATTNAFDGFTPYHPTQHLRDLDEVGEALLDIAEGRVLLQSLVAATNSAADAAKNSVARGFLELKGVLNESVRRIYVLTDREFWYRACFIDELISQSIEYFNHFCRVVVLYVGEGEPKPQRVYADIDIVKTSIESWRDELMMIARVCRPLGLFNYLDAVRVDALSTACPGARLWSLVRKQTGAFAFTIAESGESIDVTPLRYLPVPFQNTDVIKHDVIIACTDGDECALTAAQEVSEALAAGGKASLIYVIPEFGDYETEVYNFCRSARSPLWLWVGEMGPEWSFISFVVSLEGAGAAQLLRASDEETKTEVQLAQRSGEMTGENDRTLHRFRPVTFDHLSRGWDRIWDIHQRA